MAEVTFRSSSCSIEPALPKAHVLRTPGIAYLLGTHVIVQLPRIHAIACLAFVEFALSIKTVPDKDMNQPRNGMLFSDFFAVTEQ